MRSVLLRLSLSAALMMGCAGAPAAPDAPVGTADSTRLMMDLRILAADSMEGRATGSVGIERARRFLKTALREAGLQPFGTGFEQPFGLIRAGDSVPAVNLVGFVKGTDPEGPVLVVTAHYDHLGVHDGVVFNGADDNASGVAALLALTRHLAENPPRHTVVIAALDAEELGLRGAEAFVADPPVDQGRIALNVNLDMVGRNERGEIFAAGAYHYPVLRPLLQEIADRAPVRMRLGHDTPDLPPADDWTLLSDHGAFHRAGIPFVYFGVEDHPDYHEPTDDADAIEPAFFADAVGTIIMAVEHLDEALDSLP